MGESSAVDDRIKIKPSGGVGPLLYGLFFSLVVPTLLVTWAWLLDDRVQLRPLHVPWLGWPLLVVGGVLMLWSTWTLRQEAGGWPMNAYPPPRLARWGPYGVVRDPIYIGFVVATGGLFFVLGSDAGLWLVTPLVALGCASLVWGYERHDLRARFGAELPPVWLRLPPASPDRPSLSQVLATATVVFLPWFVLYEATVLLGPAKDAFSGGLPFEANWPVLTWTESIYVLAYPFAVLAPWFARSQADLRRFALRGWLATGIGIFLFHLIPLTAPPRPFVVDGFWGSLLALERAADPSPGCAFPSFHTLWALLAATLYGTHGRWASILAYGMAAAVGVSCLTTGMHVLVDLPGALLVFWGVLRMERIWSLLRRATQRLANSWHHWELGPIRIMNHGIYAALGAGLGVTGMMVAAGGDRVALGSIVTLALGSLVTAALWAQFIEGSPRLLRPYGYYGCILGGLILSPMVAWVWEIPLMLLLGAFGLAAPWIQALGRMRCLVQGCCHGAPAPESVGIRYHHERSRVCLFTEFRGVPLHPTQLYSILGNAVIGLILWRIWTVDGAPALVGGLYLVLSSFLRFVEESYRGEPQTKRWNGLAVYQWLCLLCLVLGILATVAPGPEGWPPARWNAWVGPTGLSVGLVVWLAMSVDFPRSSRRFARLTG